MRLLGWKTFAVQGLNTMGSGRPEGFPSLCTERAVRERSTFQW